jgi:hypothetical protein
MKKIYAGKTALLFKSVNNSIAVVTKSALLGEVGNGGKRKHQKEIICALVLKNLMRIIRSHNWTAKLYDITQGIEKIVHKRIKFTDEQM